MELEEIRSGKLYAAVFKDEQLKKWDSLYSDSVIKRFHKCKDLGRSEYYRLWFIWNDPRYLVSFFKRYVKYLNGAYYGGIHIDKAIDMTQDYIDPFFEMLDSANLDAVFKTLEDSPKDSKDNRFKHKIKETATERNWLRIYAVRLSKGVYVITGGSIKLWPEMHDETITEIELGKIQMLKNFLHEENIVDKETLKAYMLECEF